MANKRFAILFLAFISLACPSKPVNKDLFITIRDSYSNQIIESATGLLNPGGTPCITVDKRLKCSTKITGAADVAINANGYNSGSKHIDDVSVPEQGDFSLEPIPKFLQKLIPNGSFFKLENGGAFTHIGVTQFQLYARYLAGENIEPILSQLERFNTLRVASMCFNRVSKNPDVLAPCANEFNDNFYSKLVSFSRRLANHGFYWEFTVFIGTNTFMPDVVQQHTHWNNICWALREESNVRLELVNENSLPFNHIDTTTFDKCEWLNSSHGSGGDALGEGAPVRPAWDYETFHTNDSLEWWRKVGHNAMEFSEGTGGIPASHVPVIADENTRAPDRFNNRNQAYDAAAGGALMAGGSTFHCDNCRYSELLSDQELELADAWINGALSVPLSCQSGDYKLRNDLLVGHPELLRVYQRGTDDSCIVRIRK